MLNNFIYSETKDLFEEKLNAGEVLDEAIVFIGDTKEIWNHGTYFDGNKQLSTSTSSSMTLSPNIYYRNTSTSLSTLTITLGSVSNDNIINEYFIEFTTSSSGTTVSLPSTIKWANGESPTFEASTTYQISIVNNLGAVLKFK